MPHPAPRALVLVLAAACAANRTHPPPEAYAATDPAPLACVPNLDGTLDAAELAPALGVPVSFLVTPAASETPSDLVGAVTADGRRTWDWSQHRDTDALATLVAAPIRDRWYAESFPETAFVAPLDAGGSLEGVYAHSARALSLLGYASAEPDPAAGRTLVVYDAPADLYRFPLEVGDRWTSTSLVRNATFGGLPYAGSDTYEVEVAAAGTLELPDLRFTQALLVRILTTTAPALGVPVTVRRGSYVFECFGEVARATSRLEEPNADFTTAAEIRRLSLGDGA